MYKVAVLNKPGFYELLTASLNPSEEDEWEPCTLADMEKAFSQMGDEQDDSPSDSVLSGAAG